MLRIFLIALFLACGLALPAAAFTDAHEMNDVTVSIYAPDWIWQRREVNALIVLRNEGASSIDVQLELTLPRGHEEAFTYKGASIKTVTVPPGASVREAFTEIVTNEGYPLGAYDFRIDCRMPGVSAGSVWPLKTIRGSAMHPGKLAIALPVAISAGWTLVFAAAMAMLAGWGNWRKPGDPVTASAERPAWIDEARQ